jgi:hypothetical protein
LEVIQREIRNFNADCPREECDSSGMDELKELKAKAYDLIATIERAQAELKETNVKIAELIQKPAEEIKSEN